MPFYSSMSDLWDTFCDTHPDAWFWHRAGWLEYSACRIPDLVNCSFCVINAKRSIVGICPLIKEGTSFTFGGGPSPCPVATTDAACEEMWHHLEDVMRAYRLTQYDLRGAPPFAGTSTDSGAWNNISWQTQVLSLPSRWSDVRKSYKSLIHRACQTHSIARSTNPDDVEILHHLHVAQAGRETRHARTWTLMAEWVRTGHAYLVLAHRASGQCDGAIYVYSYKGHDYYGHAATTTSNINHALLRQAIETSTAQTFETGWQGHQQTPKDAAIEFFRRGFGGRAVDFPVSRYIRDTPCP